MIQFTKLQETHLETVLRWRMKSEVSQYMLTDISDDMEKQKEWFHKISANSDSIYWIVSYQEVPIGLINLASIDHHHRRTNMGYYLGETKYRPLGFMIPPYLYNFVFNEMKFRKIYGEVLAGNENILAMHRLHGFREVGIYKDHIFKNGKFHDLILVELLFDTWLAKEKYKGYRTQFET